MAGQFPSIVSLRAMDGHVCGGTLIAPSWVLTAGHCLDTTLNGGIDGVVLGSLSSVANDGEHLKVVRSYRHPKWDEGVLFPENDIGLLRLQTPSRSPVARLARPRERREFSPGSALQVAGWGVLDEDDYEPSESLMYGDVLLQSQHECRSMFGNFLPKSALCAGHDDGSTDSCYGDSGGPLLASGHDGPVQIGVVSGGIGCAKPGWYGLYTDVSLFGDWITELQARGDQEAPQLIACATECEATNVCEEEGGASVDSDEPPDPYDYFAAYACRQQLEQCKCDCLNDDEAATCSSQGGFWGEDVDEPSPSEEDEPSEDPSEEPSEDPIKPKVRGPLT